MSYQTYGSGSGVRQAYVSTDYPVGATIGAPTTYGTTTYTTTTGGYVPPTTTYLSGPTVTSGYVAPTTTYGGATGLYPQSHTINMGVVTTGYSGSAVGVSQSHQRAVAEEIPVESRIEYIPFQKKYIEYDRVQRIERIPYERQIVEYEEVYHTERIPVERTITDYYAVETQIQYIPKQIEETIVEYEPIERTWERVQYLPVETQIVHYPEREKYVAGQGKYIKAGYTTGSQVYTSTAPVTTTTTYQTTAPVTYQTTNVVPGFVNTAVSNYGYTSSSNYVASGPSYISSSRVNTTTVPVNSQSFVSGAHGTGSNYGYTTGGGLETSAYTSAGYAQPLSGVGYVTKDGTHLSSTGHIVSGVNTSGSQVKNNQSYQTSA